MNVGTKLLVVEESDPYLWPEETVLAEVRILVRSLKETPCQQLQVLSLYNLINGLFFLSGGGGRSQKKNCFVAAE